MNFREKPPTSAAFLVGINAYPNGDALKGCIPDVAQMTLLLTERYGVAPGSIHTLIDKAATRKNILAGLQWLAAQRVDRAYFIYSGHGVRFKTRKKDEPTGYDQAICPVDYATKGCILDDDLGKAYATIPETTRLIVHFDCCFGQFAERGVVNLANRFKNRLAGVTPRFVDETRLTDKAKTLTKGSILDWFRAKPFVPKTNIVTLSGSRHHETAADAMIGGEPHGAFTYYLGEVLDSVNGASLSYAQVIEAVNVRLAKHGYTQRAALGGNADKQNSAIYS